MNSSESVPAWDLQANQSDHGETSVICDAKGIVVCTIPSPVWDGAAVLKRPKDATNARMLVAAPKMLRALREFVAAHKQTPFGERFRSEAAFFKAEAILAAIEKPSYEATEAPAGVVASFRVAVLFPHEG